MTAHSALAWYVYAVLPARAGRTLSDGADGGEGILPGAALELVGGPDLFALTSLVPRGLFVANDPANRAGDPDWVAARAAAHHSVVHWVAAHGACLPLGFGTLFASRQGVCDWLDGQAGALHRALASVDGKREWAVALVADSARHSAWLRTGDAALGAMVERASAAGPGAAFLWQRRLTQETEAAAMRHAGAVAQHVASCVAAQGWDILAEPDRGTPAWSVLAPEGAAVADHLAAFAGSLGYNTGLTLRLTGPWPPYAFTRTALLASGQTGGASRG